MDNKDSNNLMNEELNKPAEARGSDGSSEASLEERASYDALLKELNEAQAKINEQMDSVLRSRAEIENIRKRAADDVRKAHTYGNERFLKELLPVIDSLERCLEIKVDHDMVKKVHEGVELTYQMFLQSLQKIEAEQIHPLHEEFNPALHEAIAAEAAGENVKVGSIIKVLQRGYTLAGRLIRPALVVVAK